MTGAREAQGEAYSDASGDGDGAESVGESEGGSEAEADREAALLDLLEAEGAEWVGPRDGVWHSARPSPRTNWTRLVPLPVLTGHVSSLSPY